MSKMIFALAAATALSATAAIAGVSKAESATDGRMATGQTHEMTKMTLVEKKQWKACQAMTDSQQANDSKCMELKARGAGVGMEGVTNDGLPKGK